MQLPHWWIQPPPPPQQDLFFRLHINFRQNVPMSAPPQSWIRPRFPLTWLRIAQFSKPVKYACG